MVVRWAWRRFKGNSVFAGCQVVASNRYLSAGNPKEFADNINQDDRTLTAYEFAAIRALVSW
jgi:hypothetical protein